jgi:hypothetical protein
MPLWTCGGGSLWTCGGGSLEPPPPPLGGGEEATGSLTGWGGAGLRFFGAGAGGDEGSLTTGAGAGLFFSGLFAFLFSDLVALRLFTWAPRAATGAAAGGADSASSDGWAG